jgi:hypothetical protein
LHLSEEGQADFSPSSQHKAKAERRSEMRCSAGAKQNSKNCNWELKQARTKKQARHLLYYQFELQLASDTPNRAGTHKKHV